jgi:anaerobic magnesium-protoporphyrin IX monomethyl ester cyclase
MRIAFIWPHANTVYQTIPLSFGVLYSAIRDQGHDVRMFNLPLEGWTADSPEFHHAIAAFQPDLICASVWAVSFKSAVAAVEAARRLVPQATTLVGGNYPTLNSEQAYAAGCFDYLIAGEAELSFPEFVRCLARGDRDAIGRIPGIYFHAADGAVVRNRPVFETDLDRLGPVDYDFIELDRALERGYMSTMLGPRRKVAMFATRGCEYSCHFCTAPLMNGKALRHYSVGFVTREILKLYHRHNVRMIYFMDDNGTQDRPFFKQLCRGIADLGLRDLTLELYRGIRLENLDDEMLRLMRAAGFKVATIAPESGSERVRKLMKKDMSDEDIRSVARRIREAGLSLQGYFIIGYPGETAAERRESYRMIDELGLDVFSLHKYMALPGTASFLKLVRLGKIRRDHTDESHLIGEPLPNYNGDLPADIDREILQVYLWFYLRSPWKITNLMHMASSGGLWRSLTGTAVAGLRSVVGLGRADTHVPSIREPM